MLGKQSSTCVTARNQIYYTLKCPEGQILIRIVSVKVPNRYKSFAFLPDSRNLQKGMYMSNPIITITMQNGSVMKGELYPEIAPNTVNNFISLVKKGYYNGLIFHRVIPGFMIQGGCPDGTGMGGPGYSIKGEFTQNGFKNDLKHTKGVLSMARTMAPNSAGSQFFIMHQTSPHLDGAYAAFGKITEGLDVIDAIAGVRTDFRDRPLEDQVIKSMEIDTLGADYPEPEKC